MITRSEERKETNWIAMIRLDDGTEVPCMVKDVSKSGAKLGVSSHITLPDKFMFKVIGRDFVCSVRTAWRRGNYVGVFIDQIGKLRPGPPKAAPPEPEPEPPEPPPAAPGTIQARRSRFSKY